MDHITIEKLKELARVNEPDCISIFIPTHRAGQEVNEMTDQKKFKNKVKEVRERLKSYGLAKDETEDLLEPLNELIDDTGFWKHQSDGLAVFRNRNTFDYYTLPVLFESFNYVADHFYIKPLIPYINDEGKFYLLALSLGSIKVYECYPHQINELEIEDLLPERLEEVVGYDYREKSLQFRSGQTGFNQSMFHGQGRSNEEEKKQEILKFFRTVNDGMMKLLHDKNIPLVLATVDYLTPIYREANAYKYLQEDFMPGNPEHEDPVLLHEKAKTLLEGYFNLHKKEKAQSFEQALSDQRASYKEDEIIPAAINKRVDTLFIKNREEMWGIFDYKSNKIFSRDKNSIQSSCLLNMSAIHTILNNGRVYLSDPDEMPEPVSLMNAIFRF